MRFETGLYSSFYSHQLLYIKMFTRVRTNWKLIDDCYFKGSLFY